MYKSPEVISSSPAIILKVVDLPHPDGPKRIKRSPALIVRFKPLTTSVFPYDFQTFSI